MTLWEVIARLRFHEWGEVCLLQVSLPTRVSFSSAALLGDDNILPLAAATIVAQVQESQGQEGGRTGEQSFSLFLGRIDANAGEGGRRRRVRSGGGRRF